MVIAGIKFSDKSQEDSRNVEQVVNKVLKHLGADATDVKTTRLGGKLGKNGRPPLVHVELKDETVQKLVLSKAKDLKRANDNCLKNIYISRDLTPDELEGLKRLKQQCWEMNKKLDSEDSEGRRYGSHRGTTYYYGIRNGAIHTIGRDEDKKGKIIKLSR